MRHNTIGGYYASNIRSATCNTTVLHGVGLVCLFIHFVAVAVKWISASLN